MNENNECPIEHKPACGFIISVDNLDKFITEFFRRNYGFPEIEEYCCLDFHDWADCSMHHIHIPPIPSQVYFDKEEIDGMIEYRAYRFKRPGKEYYHVAYAESILGWLCSKGVIPSGDYFIEIY